MYRSGGGTALVNVQKVVDALGLEKGDPTGAKIVSRSLEEPLRRIAENAGVKVLSLLLVEIMKKKNWIQCRYR